MTYPTLDWLLTRVRVVAPGCWQWQGGKRREYGHVDGAGPVHRLVYELMVRPIPDGKQIDHLCRMTLCVNPIHLEPVTQRENILRGRSFSAINAAKTECPKGHPFRGSNLKVRSDGSRRCLTCFGPTGRPLPNAVKTHCPRGHEYTAANTYSRLDRKGRKGRQCRTCRIGTHAHGSTTPIVPKPSVSARLGSPPVAPSTSRGSAAG